MIPGLGADADMYLPLIREMLKLQSSSSAPYSEKQSGSVTPEPSHPILCSLQFITLIDPEPGETLEQYTERILEASGLENRAFHTVIATSMGGMIAQIALANGWIKADRLFLVSTLSSGDDLTFFAKVGAPLLPFLPRFFRRPVQIVMGFLYPVVRFHLPYSVIFGRMLLRTSTDLLFFAPGMIRNWRRKKEGIPGLPVSRIEQFHGDRDPLLNWKKVSKRRPVEHRYRGASHLVFVTHAAQIAKRILS